MDRIDLNELNDVIALANNEMILESFAGFEIVEPKGKGFFTITNKRLIFHATYKGNLSSSVAIRECALENVGVISSEYGKRAHKLQRAIGIIILFLGLALLGYGIAGRFSSSLPLGNLGLPVGGGVFLIGLIVMLTSKRKMFSLEICTRTPQTSFVTFMSDFFQSPTKGKIKIKPTKETQLLIKELGKHVIEARNRL